jgi:hypothetical protein
MNLNDIISRCPQDAPQAGMWSNGQEQARTRGNAGLMNEFAEMQNVASRPCQARDERSVPGARSLGAGAFRAGSDDDPLANLRVQNAGSDRRMALFRNNMLMTALQDGSFASGAARMRARRRKEAAWLSTN